MKTFTSTQELLYQQLIEGEVIKIKGKECQVKFSRRGTATEPKNVLILVPVNTMIITEKTEIELQSSL
jgi:hypothetical protein